MIGVMGVGALASGCGSGDMPGAPTGKIAAPLGEAVPKGKKLNVDVSSRRQHKSEQPKPAN